jgi:hypothetical protein
MNVIVPNVVSDAINRALDAAIAECPDAAPDRELFYKKLLAYFSDHGSIPEFSLEKRSDSERGMVAP